MIISHRYRFIFIKTRKTAGTSIEVMLSPLCGPEDVLTPIAPPVAGHEPRNHAGLWNPLAELLESPGSAPRTLRDLASRRRFYNHIPARLVRARVARRVWDGYFKFCVERNPWDKTLSHYHMLRHRSGGRLTLEGYLREGKLCHNHPLYTDEGGALLVDRVLRYEHLVADLREVLGRLGVPFEGALPRAKSEYRAQGAETLSGAQRDLVGRAFEREIALHGYAEADVPRS